MKINKIKNNGRKHRPNIFLLLARYVPNAAKEEYMRSV